MKQTFYICEETHLYNINSICKMILLFICSSLKQYKKKNLKYFHIWYCLTITTHMDEVKHVFTNTLAMLKQKQIRVFAFQQHT